MTRSALRNQKIYRLASTAKEWIRLDIVDRSSSANKRKMVGANTEPHGTSAFTGSGWIRSPSSRTEVISLLRKLDVHDGTAGSNLNLSSFTRRPSCQPRSEGVERDQALLCAANQEYETNAGRSSVEQRILNPR